MNKIYQLDLFPKINNVDFGTGRISEIISALILYFKVESIEDLRVEQKLTFICHVLQMPPERFDKLIAENSPVLRTVQGHVFETVFDHIMSHANYEVTKIGGDDDVDRIINKFSLQLKTPTKSGTKDKTVQYKTHKTHGAKSEVESMDYYHSVHDFADLLVGLITYNPFSIIFIKKEELPRHGTDTNKILSPFSMEWENHPGLNNFRRIGINRIDVDHSIFKNDPASELLPLTSNAIGVNTNIILDTILSSSNFRIWDMSIRGFAREAQFNYLLTSFGRKIYKSKESRRERGEKADFALKKNSNNKMTFFQMKGVSTNNCIFKGRESLLACETQLTKGRVNDHPTQSRLYLKSDFDYLIIGLDPVLSKKYNQEVGNKKNKLEWTYYAIPTEDLKSHPKLPHRLKSLQTLKFIELSKYEINDSWYNIW